VPSPSLSLSFSDRHLLLLLRQRAHTIWAWGPPNVIKPSGTKAQQISHSRTASGSLLLPPALISTEVQQTNTQDWLVVFVSVLFLIPSLSPYGPGPLFQWITQTNKQTRSQEEGREGREERRKYTTQVFGVPGQTHWPKKANTMRDTMRRRMQQAYEEEVRRELNKQNAKERKGLPMGVPHLAFTTSSLVCSFSSD